MPYDLIVSITIFGNATILPQVEGYKNNPLFYQECHISLGSHKGYKRLFSHPVMVADLIKSFVKEDFVKEIDFTTLTRVNASYVSEEYLERHSDIIWEVKIKGKPVYFYILIEFQSTVYRFMALRILTYILLFYQDLLKTKKSKHGRLPSVFPVLLYSGSGKWSAPLNIDELIELPFESLTPYTPGFKYYRIAENEFSRESLIKLENIVSRLFLIETARAQDLAEIIKDVIILLKKEVNPELQRDFGIWLRRILRKRKINFDIERLDERSVRPMLEANLEKYEKKILKKGKIEKGIEIARKMKEQGYDTATIANLTGLSPEEIEKL